MAEHSYGWVKDQHDPRDLTYSAPAPVIEQLPASVDLSTDAAMPPVWDQGQLGSCTAHGTLACFLWASNKLGVGDPMLSRLMLYYDTRALEGTVGSDSGGQIRDAIKAAAGGVCPESMWPYDIDRFTVQPPPVARQAASANMAISYERVAQDARHMKACLAEGFPIDIGFTVYQSLESPEVASTGIVPMPQAGEQILGGHCVAVVGYDDATRRWKCRNSWGDQWGDRGSFYLPYEFLTDPQLASDFWVVRTVS